MTAYEDTIFEETEDGGAIIGYLTESPSGYPRPNIECLTKKQYTSYKKNPSNQDALKRYKEYMYKKQMETCNVEPQV